MDHRFLRDWGEEGRPLSFIAVLLDTLPVTGVMALVKGKDPNCPDLRTFP